MRPVSTTNQVPSRGWFAKLGRLCSAAGWVRAVGSGFPWLATTSPGIRNRNRNLSFVCRRRGATRHRMVRYVHSFEHAVKVHCRARRARRARRTSKTHASQCIDRARAPVVPEYLPTKPKASLIALAAVGITLGPATQLGEPRPKLYTCMGPSLPRLSRFTRFTGVQGSKVTRWAGR